LRRGAGPCGEKGLPADNAEAATEIVGEDDFKLGDEDVEDVFIEFAEAGLANAREKQGVLDIAMENELGGGVAFVEGGDFDGPRGKGGHGGRGQVGEGAREFAGGGSWVATRWRVRRKGDFRVL
jgi:hypothetical protein